MKAARLGVIGLAVGMIGGAALLAMLVTRGAVGILVVLYSINVFITFTLSQLGMVIHWWKLLGAVVIYSTPSMIS